MKKEGKTKKTLPEVFLRPLELCHSSAMKQKDKMMEGCLGKWEEMKTKETTLIWMNQVKF